jgi:PHD/YefM family antitoxin component YafN of YafNO toxin-antitoxin module
MDILRDVITADKLRSEQTAVFDEVLASAQPKVIIYEGEPALVLVSAASYQAQLTRLAIMEKIAAGRKDIDEGRVVTNDQVIAELQAKINETQMAIPDGES